jgi:hypothetical protein
MLTFFYSVTVKLFLIVFKISSNFLDPGCFLSFLKLSAALCCAVRVRPASERRYRAVNLRVPAVLAQFRTRYMDQVKLLLRHPPQVADQFSEFFGNAEILNSWIVKKIT